MLSMSSVRAMLPHRLVAVGLMAAAMLGTAGLPSPVAAATHAVEIGDGFFGPASLTVTIGDTVTWTNADDSPHTVTADAFDSGNIETGQTFSHTFTEPGTYTYVCQYHDEMVATITVVQAAGPAAPAAAAPSTAPASASTAPATSDTGGGTTDAAAPHSAGDHGTGQPDTALPTTAGVTLPAWVAPLLIGLGLVAFAVAVLPSHPAVRQSEPRRVPTASDGRRR